MDGWSGRTPQPIVLNQRFELDFNIESSAWQGAFDRLEVWRSMVDKYGPYAPLHGNVWAPATLPIGFTEPPSGSGPSVFISGLSIDLTVSTPSGSTPLSIAFTGSNPLTYAQAATQIAAGSQGLLTSYASGSTLVIQTVAVGEAVYLLCTGGDAAPLLGIPTAEPDSLAFGQDARIVLTLGQTQYSFVDGNGSSLYWYKTRFYNSQTLLTSDFSLPFQGPQAPGLPQSSLVLCYVDLVDLNGNAYANQEVLVYSRFNGTQVGSQTVTGGSQKLLTDVTGHAQLLLPRGLAVTVSIPGTTLARDFCVPTDPTVTTLSMLSPGVGKDDLFTVQVPNIPYAVRRTLG
jgi:hypothetical protein